MFLKRRLIFFTVTAIVTAVVIQYDIMIVKRSISNYNQNQRKDFMYRQLDDTISKQKYIENYEGEDKRGTELFQGEVIERGVRNNEAREIYLSNINR